jgi:hypothetical protein
MTERRRPRACLSCGKPLRRPHTGRPPSYCSTACRRLLENERRRLGRTIEHLEAQEREHLRQADPATRDPGVEDPDRWAARAARTRQDITRTEARLRELIAAGMEEGQP